MSSHPEISNEDCARVYRICLSCFKTNPPPDSPLRTPLHDYTERSLADFHRSLKERGLPRDESDTFEPDPFSGYRTLKAGYRVLGDVFPDLGIKAVLDWAYARRTNQPRTSFREAMEFHAAELTAAGVEDIDAFGEEVWTAVEAYHARPPR